MASVTLEHIARRAKVSVASVSKALAGDPQISASTRQRVEQISRQLNYQPRRRSGRSTARLRRVALAMCLPRGDRPWWPDRSTALIAQQCQGEEVGMELLCLDDDMTSRQSSEVTALQQVDGLLMYGYVQPSSLAWVASTGMPCVTLGLTGGDPLAAPAYGVQVATDTAAMGETATRALIRSGHRRIGICFSAAPQGLYFDCWLEGYRRAHLHAGLATDESLIHCAGRDQKLRVGASAAESVLAMPDPPTGYVFPDEWMAVMYMDVMHQAGRPVRRESIVVGGQKSDPAHYHLEDYPQVTEDMPAVVDTALRVLADQAAGRKYPPGLRMFVPYQSANLPSPAQHSGDNT